MLFPTLNFLLFFLVVAAGMVALGERFEAKKRWLALASYVFYAQWNWHFCFLLAGSSVLSYSAGWLIGTSRVPRFRRAVLTGAITLHLGVLGLFKYYDFFIDSTNTLLHGLGYSTELPFLDVILPVGISFFTFHGISYLVDVYRGDVAICRRLSDMLLYMSFFPQLVAGPIVRASFFLPQLTTRPVEKLPIGPALVLIGVGLFKKTIIANYLATGLVDPVFFAPAEQTGPDLILALYGYAVQIYCDFSAYSDMAVGLAALLGFHFPRNFDQPYRAQGLSEFWQRWHITLSSWLRDYLYIPLGGNRGGLPRTLFNLAVTMFLGGIWHGAAWKFVFWGLLHGAGLGIERVFAPLSPRNRGGLIRQSLATLLVFHFVCLGWVFFRADSFESAWLYLACLPGHWDQGIKLANPLTIGLILLGLIGQFTPPRLLGRLSDFVSGLPVWGMGVLAGLFAAVVEGLGPDGIAPFIYFQF